MDASGESDVCIVGTEAAKRGRNKQCERYSAARREILASGKYRRLTSRWMIIVLLGITKINVIGTQLKIKRDLEIL